MYELIFALPNSRLIFLLTIFAIVVQLLLILGVMLNIFVYLGPTLAQWIEKQRTKGDATNAANLRRVRKLLEILAHDVLKHRLLGMVSLSEEVKNVKKQDGSYELTNDQLDGVREEMFRLCGVKSAPEERLWKKWGKTFWEIRKIAHFYLVAPHIDPMLMDTTRAMIKLRSMFHLFVSKDKAKAVTPEAIEALHLEKCGNIYQQILELAAACRMVIEPEIIIKQAIDMLSVQTGRADALKRIHMQNVPKGRWLCTAAPQTIAMCLMRVIDNALTVGGDVLIQCELSSDDFTGAQFLIFRTYDESDKLPEPSQYGLGLRGVLHEMNEFEGGFRFRLDSKDKYKKAAILSLPVFDYLPIQPKKKSHKYLSIFVIISIFLISLFVFCVARITGGLPVEFAGEGTSVIEFPVNVGHELVIPLCTGGSNVHASVTMDQNAACWQDNCSLYAVLESLQACSQSMNHPDCPGELRWKPQFEDGKRQGKSYELTVNCISDGPPASKDSKNIRILVSRPNTAPELINIIVDNATTGEKTSISGRPVKVGAADRLTIRALAVDSDSDVIQYKLKLPNGTIVTSYDGAFQIEPEWSEFAIWNAEIEITDTIAPPIKMPVQLRATTFHPIELREVSVWQPQSNTYTPCYSFVDNHHVCNLVDQPSNDIRVSAWFDPLQKVIAPQFELYEGENTQHAIRYISANNKSRPGHQSGDRWEIYDKLTNEVKARAELTYIEKTNVPGVYEFIFNILTNNIERSQFPFTLFIRDASQKLPENATFLLFNFEPLSRSDVVFATKHVQLREYESENDASEASASAAFYSVLNAKDLKPSFGNFACNNPAFENAFEPIAFKKSATGWLVEFKLKPGCIHGLNSKLDARERLCSLELFLDPEKKQSETIWVTLEDRKCTPKIENLELSSTQDQLSQNLFRWQFKIFDPDGDLSQDQIQLTGRTSTSLFLESGIDNATYFGIAAVQGNCLKAFVPPVLQARDQSGLIAEANLSAQLSCEPLVTLSDPKTDFFVNDGERIKLPLVFDADVTPHVQTRLGRIENDAFVWDATCRYGEGPLPVVINGDSETRVGAPLRFTLNVRQCKPNFNIRSDNEILNTARPLIIPIEASRTITLSSSNLDLSQYTYMTVLDRESSDLSIRTDASAWSTVVSCSNSPSQNMLRLFIKKDGSDPTNIDNIEIRCIEP